MARDLAIPATFITMGFVTMGTRPVIPMNLEIREEIQEHYPGFKTLPQPMPQAGSYWMTCHRRPSGSFQVMVPGPSASGR
jgi:hypothetical protein